MISDDEANAVADALKRVTTGDLISSFEFTSEDLDELVSRHQNGSETTYNPREYFAYSGYDICSSCNSELPRCTCGNSKPTSVHEIDADKIVTEWCDTIQELPQYSNADTVIHGPPTWTIKVESIEHGLVDFSVVSEAAEFSSSNPSYLSQDFVVSLVESSEIADRDGFYMWYQLLTEGQHEDMLTKIRDLQNPFSEAVCNYTGPAQDQDTDIRNYLQEYIEWRGFKQANLRTVEPRVTQILDLSKVRYAAHKEGDGTIVICGCDKSSDDVHIHYIVDQEIQPVSESDIAEDAASLMSKKVGKLESLSRKTKDFSDRGRVLAVVLTFAGLSAGFPFVASLITPSNSGLTTYSQMIQAVLLALTFILFVVSIAAPIRLQMHSLELVTWRRRLHRALFSVAKAVRNTGR